MKDLTFDEILEMNKENYAIMYDEIKQIRLHNPKSRWKRLEFAVFTEEFDVYFMPTEEQFKQLTALLSTIAVLKDKIVP